MQLSVREAADKLGVSTALVYALCARKRIRHERHGIGRGRIRITEQALEEYRLAVTIDAEPMTNTNQQRATDAIQ